MSKRVFISQPMRGKTLEQIYAARQEAIDDIEKRHLIKENFYVLETIVHTNQPPLAGKLWFLGQSISKLDEADYIYMCPGWRYAKGCCVEFMAAQAYGITVLYAPKEDIWKNMYMVKAVPGFPDPEDLIPDEDDLK